MNHPFKLGKLAPKFDDRTLKLRSVLRAPMKLPPTYSVDIAHPGCRPRMFLNDTYGDCVMAARAEQQMRFDFLRSGKVPNITDAEVKREYFKESGGQDSGLNILDSLKAWQQGWKAGGKQERIHSFASVNFKNLTEVKTAIFINGGIPIGVALPDDAMDYFMHGKAWSNTKRPADPNEGHCIYLVGWTMTTLTAITWAQYQPLTPTWLRKYCDESYLVIDDPNNPKVKRAIDRAKVEAHLNKVAL